MLNDLGESFATYLIILNESTRRNKDFSSLDVLFKNLKDEKTRMRLDFIVVANLATREKDKKKTKNKSSDFKSDEKKKKRSKNDYTCNRCERSDHYFNDCFHKNSECNSCHRVDHLQRMCRFEEEKKEEEEEENNRNVFLMIKISDPTCEFTSVILINDQITKKILDSETIDHIFCNKELFSFITLKFNSFETGTGDKFKIDGVGRVILTLADEKGKKCTVTLNDVLYSPQLQYNLISTMRLTKSKIETMLRLSGRSFKLILNDEVIDVVDVINNQYILREVQSHEVKVTLEIVLSVTESFIQIWHARLGHLGYENVIKMKNLITSIDFTGLKSEEICETCMKDRQKRIVNRISRTRSAKFLDIIHFDLDGSLSLTRKEEMHYIIFRDDWSGSI
jgi:hypothetical protein